MSNRVKSFLFILLIPFFFALGHDVYLNYFSDDTKIEKIKALEVEPKGFNTTDFGWVWVNYSKESFDLTRNNVSTETWRNVVSPLLKMKTMLVGAIPYFIGLVYLLLAWIIGIWPFAHLNRFKSFGGSKGKSKGVYKNAKASRTKYKR